MFAYISLPLLCLTAFSTGYTIKAPNFTKMESEISDMNRVNQFLSLVDMEKMTELMTLEKSPLFNSAINQIATMDELKQILELLESKGYSMEFLSDVFNTFLTSSMRNTKQGQFVADSVEDMKVALVQNNYLESNPEVARLLETLNTEEFINMLNKLVEKIKELIDNYTSAITKRVCDFLNKILGDKFTSPLCQ